MTTTNFYTYTLNDEECSLQDLQRSVHPLGIERDRLIYESLQSAQRDASNMIYSVALLNRLMQAPTAYENDTLYPEILDKIESYLAVLWTVRVIH